MNNLYNALWLATYGFVMFCHCHPYSCDSRAISQQLNCQRTSETQAKLPPPPMHLLQRRSRPSLLQLVQQKGSPHFHAVSWSVSASKQQTDKSWLLGRNMSQLAISLIFHTVATDPTSLQKTLGETVKAVKIEDSLPGTYLRTGVTATSALHECKRFSLACSSTMHMLEKFPKFPTDCI